MIRTIAVLGGTGKEGKGLVMRWAKAGYHVLIGSRSHDKAKAAALVILEYLGGKAFIEGTTNRLAAQSADITILAVPFIAHRAILEEIKDVMKGKILIDVTVPLVPPELSKVQMPSDGSAALEAYRILGEDSQVTSAFQNISYDHLLHEDLIACEVLVTGTSKGARVETLKLVTAAGLIGWDAGPIENSVVVEGLTSVLLYINKQYGTKNAGIRITGLSEKPRIQTGLRP
jgi:NADPH-dependent F420 reductase